MWLYLVYYFPKLQECCHNDDEAMDEDGGTIGSWWSRYRDLPSLCITPAYSPLSTQRAHLTAFKTSNMKRMVSLLTHGREIYHSVNNRLQSFVSSCHHVTKTATANTILAPHTLDIWINILNCMDSVYFVDNTQYYVNVLLAHKGWL